MRDLHFEVSVGTLNYYGRSFDVIVEAVDRKRFSVSVIKDGNAVERTEAVFDMVELYSGKASEEIDDIVTRLKEKHL